jgi:hypothetical protein
MNEAEYQEYIRPWFRVINDDVVSYSEDAKEWIEKQNFNYDYNSMTIGISLVRVIPCAWYQENDKNNCNLIFEHHLEKEEGYSVQFLREIIFSENGKTKDEVYTELGDVFKGCRHDWTGEIKNLQYHISLELGMHSTMHSTMQCFAQCYENER